MSRFCCHFCLPKTDDLINEIDAEEMENQTTEYEIRERALVAEGSAEFALVRGVGLDT